MLIMSRKSLTATVTVCLGLLLYCSRGLGQSVYGDVSGTLTDASDAPIPGAIVTVISVEKGTKFKTTTNQSGQFSVTHLLPDTYNLSVQSEGFRTLQDTGIPVFADQTSRINGKLSRGNSADVAAAVVGEVSILKTDRTDVSTMFTSATLESLPILDLNVARFTLLVPGALPGITGLPPEQNPQRGPAIDINGQHFSGTASQLDGTANRDPLQGFIVINPTLESVNEMKVTTQNYSAEFGEATAGVLTIQTRSGTNAWHGSAFDYRRSDWGQAGVPFAFGGVPPIKRNEFGGSLGGPIVRSRFFLFGDYQGTRQAVGFDQLLSVPTQLVHQTCVGGLSGNCDLSEYLSIAQVYDPSTHLPYGSNRIPNSLISQAAVNVLGLLPLPNNANHGIVNNYEASGLEVFNADQFNLRADLNVTGKFRVFGRYSFADFRDDGSGAFGAAAGGAGTNAQGYAGIAKTRNQGLSIGFSYAFRPSLLADFRFGFFRYHLNLNSPDLGTEPALNLALTPGLNNDLYSSGLPDFEIPGQLAGQIFNPSLGTDYLRFGYSNAVNSCNCPLREVENEFQGVNNWIKTSGSHAFKWGADVRFLTNYRLASDRRRAGHLTFNPSVTGLGTQTAPGLGLATFLFGDITSLDRYFSNPQNPVSLNAGEHQTRTFFYAQDTWQASHRLTINYGLRWEIYFPQTVTAKAGGGFLVPDFNSPMASMFRVPGTQGVDSHGNVKISLNNLGPRIGIAFLAAPNTVIRAGYGRSFDGGHGGSIFGIAATQNPPIMISLQNIPAVGAPLHLGQPVPAFTFPTLAGSFSIAELYNDLIAGSPQNQGVVYAMPGKLRLPTVDAWNFTIQHQLSTSMYFELGYVGNKGTHVSTDASARTSFYDLNQTSLNHFIIPGNSNTNTNCAPKQPTGNFCKSNPITRKLFNPWPSSILYFGDSASNNYNSLQAQLHKRFRQGYEILAHYTWAKGLDYDNNYFNTDPRVGYGPSNFDRSHVFVLANVWSLPVGRDRALLGGIGPVFDRIVGGWALSMITTWYSGLPFTPTYNNCVADQMNAGAPCRPNLVGTVHVTGSRNGYFTAAGTTLTPGTFNALTGNVSPGGISGPWQRPAPGTIGNVARNSIRGPGFFQSDVALSKAIHLRESLALRFRADMFNIFNKANLGNPNPCVDCSNAGTIAAAIASGDTPREFQFSLKLEF
jgi:Carboxypeptidase regulatory-like domain/TonB dependent receptor